MGKHVQYFFGQNLGKTTLCFVEVTVAASKTSCSSTAAAVDTTPDNQPLL